MRKKLLSLIAFWLFICLAVVFITCVIGKMWTIPVSIKDIYNKVYQNSVVEIETEKDVFKILKISDLHLINGEKQTDKRTYEIIENLIKEQPFDLAIVVGDIVEGFNFKIKYNKYNAVSVLADIFDKQNLPWTFAPGNNDVEMQGGNRELISHLLAESETFFVGNNENTDGDVNFVIDIKRNGVTAHSLIVLDSHSRVFPIIGRYDSIKPSQTEYVGKIATARNNPISIFFHMPTPEFEQAYNYGEKVTGYRAERKKSYAENGGNAAFDEGIKNLKNITLVSCGHIHQNNMAAFYNGRYYELNSKSGYYGGIGDGTSSACTEIAINLTEKDPKTIYSLRQRYSDK